MANVPAQYEIPQSISQRLAALRGKITLWLLIEGLGRVLAVALLVFAIDLMLDWYFRLDRMQRGAILVMMLGVIGLVVWRKMWLPLSSQVGDDALLLQVESKHRELGESVISAAQFSRISDLDRLGISRSMVDATIRRGIAEADRINFSDVLNGQRFGYNVLILVVALALTLGLGVGVAMGGPLQTWFYRNILLDNNARWPQNTYLEIVGAEDGVISLIRGENATQLVRVTDNSEVPDSVRIEFYPSRGRPSQNMKKLANNDFEVQFTNVIEEFQFRARGGDAITETVRVKLVEPPAPKSLQLMVTMPDYVGKKAEKLPEGKGPYQILEGSSLHITGIANKPLSKAELVIDHSSQAGETVPQTRIPLTLTESTTKDAFEGHLSPEQLKSGKYILELTDAGNLMSKRPTTFSIATKADMPPQFVAARIVGVSGMVITKAQVPYMVKVKDDYGITKVKFGYRWRGEAADSGDEGSLEPGSLAKVTLTPALEINDIFDLEKLKLQPGTTLTMFLEATDNKTTPNVGKSADFLLRIVTEDQLRQDLLRREKEQRQELERLLKTEQDLIVETQVLRAAVGDTADFIDEHRVQLMAMQKRQNQIGTSLGGVGNVFENIRVEVVNNRLEEPGGKLESRLSEGIVAPLRKLATVDTLEIVSALDRSRRESKKVAERTKALDETEKRQNDVVKMIKTILATMERTELYQDAINALEATRQEQEKAMQEAEKERQLRIKKALENGGKPSTEEKPVEPAPKKPDEEPKKE